MCQRFPSHVLVLVPGSEVHDAGGDCLLQFAWRFALSCALASAATIAQSERCTYAHDCRPSGSSVVIAHRAPHWRSAGHYSGRFLHCSLDSSAEYAAASWSGLLTWWRLDRDQHNYWVRHASMSNPAAQARNPTSITPDIKALKVRGCVRRRYGSDSCL